MIKFTLPIQGETSSCLSIATFRNNGFPRLWELPGLRQAPKITVLRGKSSEERTDDEDHDLEGPAWLVPTSLQPLLALSCTSYHTRQISDTLQGYECAPSHHRATGERSFYSFPWHLLLSADPTVSSQISLQASLPLGRDLTPQHWSRVFTHSNIKLFFLEVFTPIYNYTLISPDNWDIRIHQKKVDNI